MEEKSNIEILREFAQSTNRAIFEKELAYPKSGIGTIQKFKNMVFIPNNAEKTSFFIWFSDPFGGIGSSTVFCGAFIPIPSFIKSKINIRRKNVLDKIDVFAKSNKMGIESFDSKFIIKGDIGVAEKRLLSPSKIQDLLMKALDIEGILNISINEHNLDFVPELKGNSYLSIINPHTWILERDFIEEGFRQIEKIRFAVGLVGNES